MTRKIHKRIFRSPPTRQGKFLKHEELFQNPLDIFKTSEENHLSFYFLYTNVTL